MDFSIVTCVSNQDVFHRALGSSLARAQEEPVELIAIDNAGNRYSAPQALNLGAARAQGEVLVFLHQDVLLPEGWFGRLAEGIRTVEQHFGSWGVLGVFGVSLWGWMVGHVQDPHGHRKWGRLPCRVQSLDEVCLVVRRDSGLHFDEELGGFHFYGADLCLQAQQRGTHCYAVDACLQHLSGGKVDGQFWEVARRFEAKWRRTPGGPRIVETTCSVVRTKTGAPAAWLERTTGLRRRVYGRLRRALEAVGSREAP